MGAILVIARTDGDLHGCTGLAQKFTVAQCRLGGCVAIAAKGNRAVVEGREHGVVWWGEVSSS